MSKIQDAWIVYQYALKKGFSQDDIDVCDHNLSKLVKSYISNLSKPRQEDNSWLESFEIFWNAYDKKVGRKNAENAWRRLTKSEKRMAINSVGEYVKSTPTIKYRKNPATWLNANGWEDEVKRTKPTIKQYDGKRDDLFQ